jgi:hypothetical protein
MQEAYILERGDYIMKKHILLSFTLLTLLFLALLIGCGGGGSSTVVPVQPTATNTPVITPTPTVPSSTATPKPTATSIPITYGNISGQVLNSSGTPGFANAFVVFQSFTSSQKSISLVSSGIYTQTTTANSSGYYSFANVPQGACNIAFWASQSTYQAGPYNPLGSVNTTVTTNTVGVVIYQGQVAPTPTNSPVLTPTNTPLPVSTPTLTPTPNGNTDLGSEFDMKTVIYQNNTTVVPNNGSLVIQLRQKSTSTLVIKGFSILVADNPTFPFLSANASGGPSTWDKLTGSNFFSWTGTDALTKGTSFNYLINYSVTPPSFPATVKIIVTGYNNTRLGYLELGIVK